MGGFGSDFGVGVPSSCGDLTLEVLPFFQEGYWLRVFTGGFQLSFIASSFHRNAKGSNQYKPDLPTFLFYVVDISLLVSCFPRTSPIVLSLSGCLGR